LFYNQEFGYSRSPEEMVSQFLLNTEPRIGSRNSFIVQINTTEDLKAFSGLKIDQMVYFITKKDEIVYETYSINGMTILQKIGHFDGNLWNWEWEEKYSLKRRENFHGIELNVMTDYQLPFVEFLDDWVVMAPIINSTYYKVLTKIIKYRRFKIKGLNYNRWL
jgi:hypothetical protein